MIRAVVFDLDGTLVQTEKLKALSYARAAVELCPRAITEEQVVEAFKEVVGRPRREVAQALMERFDLEPKSRDRMAEFGVSSPWQVLVQIRLGHYEAMVADPEVLRRNQWPHNRALLEEARRVRCQTALASMSRRDQVRRVLDALELSQSFQFVATREDVEKGKPDPEIYLLVAQELGVPSGECLVVEDSPSGVQAAIAAETNVIAVATPFTLEGLRGLEELDPRWLVEDPETLPAVVRQRIEVHERIAHSVR